MERYGDDFFRRVVANTTDVVWILTRDGARIEFINHDFSGIDREKILEEGISAVWPVMDIGCLEELLAAFKRAVEMKEPVEDVRTRHANPITRKEEFYQHTVIPIHPGGDEPVTHIQVVSRDITTVYQAHRIFSILDEVSAEIQKKTSRDNIIEFVGRRLKKNGISVIVGLMSEDRSTTRVVYSSIPKRKMRKALSLVGYDMVGDAVPTGRWALLPKVIRKRRPLYFDDPLTFLKLGVPDVDLRKRMKTVVELLDLGRIIYAPLIVDQRVIGTLTVISRDLTEMHLNAVQTFAAQFSHCLVQSRLCAENRRLQDLLEDVMNGLDSGLFVAGSTGRIIGWNSALQALLGYTHSDVIGKHVRTIGVDDDLWKEICTECSGRDERWRGSFGLRKKAAGKSRYRACAFEITRQRDSERGIACVVRKS